MSARSRLVRSELRLVFGRRRNLAGLAILGLVPIVVATAMKLSNSEPGSEAPEFIRSITENGLFVALAALGLELPFFLPLAVGVVAGDSVAGEASTGTLRYLLTVPVNRTRLLVVKYAAIVGFVLAAVLTVVVTGAVVGIALFGTGDMILFSGTTVGFGGGVARVLLAAGYVALCLCSLGAIGLFFSTLTEQPIGAAVAVVIVNILSLILDQIPQLDWLGPYLPTHWWLSFAEAFRDPIGWETMGKGAFVAVAYILISWLAAWARFSSKDITS